MKRRIIKGLLCACLLIVAFMGFCEAISEDITKGVVRLHVIANSDSKQDQAVKLLVRDAVLQASKTLSAGTPMDLSFAEENREILLEVANHVLKENNCSYNCQIETGMFSFPTRQYDAIFLPAGTYRAVRITLGEGKGKNWWCVLYPPLCFTEHAVEKVSKEQQKALSDAVGDAGYRAISGEEVMLIPAFKAVEIWNTIKQNFSLQNKPLLPF